MSERNKDQQFSFNNDQQSQHSFQQQKNNHKNQPQDVILKLQSKLDEDFQQQHRSENNSPSKQSAHTKSNLKNNQLEIIKRFFRKQYEPVYFNNVQMKELNFKQDSNIQVRKYKEAYFLGQFNQKGQKQGLGILVYHIHNTKSKNNSIVYNRRYQGNWKQDKKHGQGYQKFADNSVYKGQYEKGKPNGKGKFVNPQGQVYEGQWLNGLKHGRGFWKGALGQTYLGQWNQGKPQGYGVYVNQRGDRYEGQFRDSLKHGQGIQRFVNGDIYKGFYQNGKPGGFGQYYWKNKSYFKGYFKNGLRCGQGLWKKGAGNCDKYQGQYENDKKWGFGTFTWQNGNVYKGNYSGDLRNGYGQMYWYNGSYYKGQWLKGVQNGQGEIFIVQQGLRRGLFDNNEIIRIDYEQLIDENDSHGEIDSENEQNQMKQSMNNSLVSKKVQQKKLSKNTSNISFISAASKKSKFSKSSKLSKPLTIKQKTKEKNASEKQFHYPNNNIKQIKQKSENQKKENNIRPKILSQIKNNKKIQSNGMRSVPLKKIFSKQTDLNDRYSTTKQNNAPFRIQVKTTQDMRSGNLNSSFDSKVRKSTDNFKKKDRLLHSSFYLHRFKNIGRPNSNMTPVFADKIKDFTTVE